MGKAMVIIRVYPEDPEDLAKLEKALKTVKAGEFRDMRREPIAFGLELLRVGYLIPDKQEGAMIKLEEAVKEIPGVKEIEVEGITLI